MIAVVNCSCSIGDLICGVLHAHLYVYHLIELVVDSDMYHLDTILPCGAHYHQVESRECIVIRERIQLEAQSPASNKYSLRWLYWAQTCSSLEDS